MYVRYLLHTIVETVEGGVHVCMLGLNRAVINQVRMMANIPFKHMHIIKYQCALLDVYWPFACFDKPKNH